MIYIALTQTLLGAGLVALLYLTQRREIATIHGLLEIQDSERQNTLTALNRPHPDIAALVDLVDRLCQRVQAPEQAVIDHTLTQPVPPLPPTVHPSASDAAFWEAMQAATLSKDELAEAAMSQEVNGS